MTGIAERLGRAGAWLFLAAIAVTLWEVAARYLLNAPTSWAHALSACLCGIAFALGGAFAEAREEHVRIGAFYDRFRPALRRRVDTLGLLLGAFYLAGLGYGLSDQAIDAAWRFDWEGRWTPELTPGPPNWPLPTALRLALLFGTALFLLLVLRRLAAQRRMPPR